MEASLGGLLAQKQREAADQAKSHGLERHDLERHAMGTLAADLQGQMVRMQMQVRQVAHQMNAQYEQQLGTNREASAVMHKLNEHHQTLQWLNASASNMEREIAELEASHRF
jgi:hypothetical protein